jgi:hypothetical protein
MIKFKEQDGELFRMLDKPVPLTPDAEMPCIIVPIQDDSPMGRYVKQCWGHDKLFMREYTICGINTDMAAKVGVAKDTPLSIHMFEIIGTFVKVGSEDWAWYQMMKGEKISYAKLISKRFYAIKKGCDYCAFYESDGNEVGFNTRRTYGEFIEYSKRFGISSWQIYKEPEPEYKAGDFVEIINWYSGTKHLSQIDSIDHEIHIGTHRFDTNGNSAMETLPQLNIIRKLKPSEVIVEIGCLSGTVKDLSYVEDGKFWFIGKKTERCPGGMHCILYLEMLDTPTRKLVEGLLRAQKIKKTNAQKEEYND